MDLRPGAPLLPQPPIKMVDYGPPSYVNHVPTFRGVPYVPEDRRPEKKYYCAKCGNFFESFLHREPSGCAVCHAADWYLLYDFWTQEAQDFNFLVMGHWRAYIAKKEGVKRRARERAGAYYREEVGREG